MPHTTSWTLRPYAACAVLLSGLATGCSTLDTRPTKPDDTRAVPAPADAAPRPAPISSLQDLVPASGEERNIGVALAGGGTKAAAYAMGVIAGLTDHDLLTTRVRAISSVSGGGYAALFLYSKLMASEKNGRPGDPKTFFEDCIPLVYRHLFDHAPGKQRLCPWPRVPDVSGYRAGSAVDPAMKPFLYQHFVRCRQDVLENDCHLEHIREDPADQATRWSRDHPHWATAAGLVVAQVAAVGPNFVARTLFDWPVNLSPLREAYLQGIGTAYALFPNDVQALKFSRNLAESCQDFSNCRQVPGENGAGRLNRAELTFAHLQAFATRHPEMPTWVINATASPSRSIFGWARQGQRDFSRYTLHIASRGAWSGHYGPTTAFHAQPPAQAGEGPRRDLLDAVTTSAAFFDSNQTAWEPRFIPALLQHALALDWGIDIPNERVDGLRPLVHKALPLWPLRLGSSSVVPVPTYFADSLLTQRQDRRTNEASSYIRLLDGGNNDNLGAYALIELGVKHLVISDHSQDEEGLMQDLCLLHHEVGLRQRRALLVPGLKGFERHCRPYKGHSDLRHVSPQERADFLRAAASPPAAAASPAALPSLKPEVGKPIHRWPYRILLGCIVPLTPAAHDGCRAQVDTYVYVLKPAFDREDFLRRFLTDAGARPGLDRQVDRRACEGADRWACEVAAYLALQHRYDGETDPFPQHGTVGMTYASNALRYGAYRDLARWQMAGLRELLDGGAQAFVAELDRQVASPIKLPGAQECDAAASRRRETN